jgi:fructose/tagatose bisphosphate aldolase
MTAAGDTLSTWPDVPSLLAALGGAMRVDGHGLVILDERAVRERTIDDLVRNAVFADEPVRSASRWLIRQTATALGAFPASIHDLYMAAGRGDYANATAPAINVRGLSYDTMRAVFRAAHANTCKIVLFELARSEMGYTEQRPSEYAAVAFAAAVKEGHRGPVFVQGDHYQINAKRYAADAEGEVGAVRDLALEAIAAGYFNIDIDASTIVDVSLPTLEEQQTLNARHTAALTRAIREVEPAGVTVSVGGEIGEVGERNSTIEDLHAFMEQYVALLDEKSRAAGRDLTGMSKVSVQTGTSHGGIVLPDGTLQEVAVDFATLGALSREARERYGMGGAVQHGASTLPVESFDKFAEASAVEVHLATAFQNTVFDHPGFPTALRDEIYAYLGANHADERKPSQTDAQFHYSARKRAWGPFKAQLWALPEAARNELAGALEEQFGLIMRRLGVANTADLVDRLVRRVDVQVPAPDGLLAGLRGERVAAGGGRETYEQVEGE